MTPEEFKKRWESNANGGGITFDDIADCARKWGLYSTPKIHDIAEVRYKVLQTAETNDCEDFHPTKVGYDWHQHDT